MAGVGVEYNKAEIAEISRALERMSLWRGQELLKYVGEELYNLSQEAFRRQKDPATGKSWQKWSPRYAELQRNPPKNYKASSSLLHKRGILQKSVDYEVFMDSVVLGSNLIYSRIHQRGDSKRNIPERPYLGWPKGFEREILSDPKVLEILGLGS